VENTFGANHVNRLTTGLAAVCRDHLLEQKWLVAPSLRAGHQWLTTVTRNGQPIVNCRVTTVPRLALELAASRLVHAGVELASHRQGLFVVEQVFRRLCDTTDGYLAKPEHSMGLIESIYRSIVSVRRAGLTPDHLHSDRFEVAQKGNELSAILREYMAELRRRKLVDRADIFRMAVTVLREDFTTLPSDVLILLPEDINAVGLERGFLESLPAGQVLTLLVDQPGKPAEGDFQSDAALLRWLPALADAPLPKNDSSAAIFRAVGEANEVREVLRQALAAGWPLDQIEILVSDRLTYVPLIYETFARLLADGEAVDDIPVTFHEGLSARQLRPGRALAAWLSWIEEGFHQPTLVRMIQEGLLEVPNTADEEISFSRLSGDLAAIGIGFGRDRYLPRLDEAIGAVQKKMSDRNPDDAEGGRDARRRVALQGELKRLHCLRDLIKRLLDVSPADTPRSTPHAPRPTLLLPSARRFLNELARSVTRLDNYARVTLTEEIDNVMVCLGDDQYTFNPWDWLTVLPDEVHIGGSGPMPGCVHVADLSSGGHSGRARTFIVGLDDRRFLGAGLEDPVLLDRERRRLSPSLPTAATLLRERLDAFNLLLARLRGTITLSYCCQDLADGSEMFPSPIVLSAFRILSGQHEGDQADLVRWLPPAASFAPDKPEKALTDGEWWLWRLCGSGPIADAPAAVAQCYPHLGRGYRAERERASDRFTVYDGWLARPATDLDPTAENGPIMSARRFETMGRCPLAYFFQQVLDIEPFHDDEIDPDRWLDPLKQGELLHRVFEQFIQELAARNEVPVFSRDEPRLLNLLNDNVRRYRGRVPPPGEAVFERQCRRLQRICRIFLAEEEEYARSGNRPLFLEVGIGMREGKAPLDIEDPVVVRLPNGRQIRARGRMDRIDGIAGDTKALFVHDYKTGSATKYEDRRPYNQGRTVQHALYLELLRARLRTLAGEFSGMRVEGFGYFFPGDKERGRRLEYAANELVEGMRVLQALSQIAASGSFLATNCVDDCKFCDYRPVCGDIETVVSQSAAKLANAANGEILQPILELRSP
jgi:ATP-dependent helicase/nuclease subunit B